MENQKHMDILKQGVEIWNQWRQEHPEIRPDLSSAGLSGADLTRANFARANLSSAYLMDTTLNGAILSGANLNYAILNDARLVQADLRGASLVEAKLNEAILIKTNLCEADLAYAYLNEADLEVANLQGADLTRAILSGADLSFAVLSEVNLSSAILPHAILKGANLRDANLIHANLKGAILSGADFSGANLSGAELEINALKETLSIREANLSGNNLNYEDFSGMDLSGVNLNETSLIKTNFSHANLSNCSIYGIAAWDIQLDEQTVQKNLRITPPDEPILTVDNLKVAQFIYLLLNNAEIRGVIDTIGHKGVLILGRFTPDRKAVLDALRDELRRLNFVPIVFDFERPSTHDFTETIMTLAGLSCFIIADITNPKSSPLELQATVPNYMTPFVPIIQEGEQPFAMFIDLQNKHREWVLDTLIYDTPSNLINRLERAVVQPALARQADLMLIKAQGLRTRHIKDYS